MHVLLCTATTDATVTATTSRLLWLVRSGPAHARSGVLNIILGVVLTAIFVIVMAFCVVQLRRRKRGKKHETVTVHFLTHSAVDNDTQIISEPSPTHVSANGLHSLFTEQTEKVSIVWYQHLLSQLQLLHQYTSSAPADIPRDASEASLLHTIWKCSCVKSQKWRYSLRRPLIHATTGPRTAAAPSL